MTGPMTRDAFIWAEFSEMAPGRSARSDQSGEDGRVGRAEHGAAHADHHHHDDQHDMRRRRGPDHPGQGQREHQLLDGQDDQELLAVDLVGDEAAHHGEQERRAELGEDDDADERARVGDVVGVGAEDDVLHPGADVGGEGAEEDDAKGAVPQGRDGRARPERAVTVDDGILDLLDGDVGERCLALGISRHGPMVRDVVRLDPGVIRADHSAWLRPPGR